MPSNFCTVLGLSALRASLWLASALFLATLPAHSQSSCPPPGSARGDGNDIKCRIQNTLSKNETLLTTVKNKMGECNHPKCALRQQQIARAQAAHNRAVSANSRLTGDDFAELNRKRKGKQQDSSTTLAPKPLAANDPDIDPTIGQELADQLDEAGVALDQANTELALPPPPTIIPPVIPNLYDYTTDPGYPAWLHTTPQNTAAEFAVLVLFRAVKLVEGGTTKLCEQTAVAFGFGGNGSLGCVALALLSNGLETTHEVFKFIGDDTLSWETRGAYHRAGDIFLNLQSVTSTVGSVATSVGDISPRIAKHDADIKALAATLKQMIQENNQLLKKIYALERDLMKVMLTNDGQKAATPAALTCTGDDCPQVLNCPGTQCKYPIKDP